MFVDATPSGDPARMLNSFHGASHLLSDREVAVITGRARSTLQKDRLYGGGIPFVRVGRLVRYRRQDLAAWLAALPTRTSTST